MVWLYKINIIISAHVNFFLQRGKNYKIIVFSSFERIFKRFILFPNLIVYWIKITIARALFIRFI